MDTISLEKPTCLPHFSHHSHDIPTTLFTRSHHVPTALSQTCAPCTSIYLPHFSYTLHHIHSPTDHTFYTLRCISLKPIYHALHTIHIISFHTYNTYDILRPSNLHLSTLLFTPFALPTFTYLPHYPDTSASSLHLEINPCGRLGTRRRLYG